MSEEDQPDINTAIANESVKNLEAAAGSSLSSRRSRLRSALKNRSVEKSAASSGEAGEAGSAKSRIAARRQARLEKAAEAENQPPEDQTTDDDNTIQKSEVSAKPKSALARFRSALSKVRSETSKKNEVTEKARDLKEKFQEKLALKELVKQSLRFGAFHQVVERLNDLSKGFSAWVGEIVVTVSPPYTPQYGDFRRKHDRLWDQYETDREKLKYLDEINVEDLSKIRAMKVAEGIAAVKAEMANTPQKTVGKIFSRPHDTNFSQAVNQFTEKLGSSPYTKDTD